MVFRSYCPERFDPVCPNPLATMKTSALLLNTAWIAAQSPRYLLFRRALVDSRATQESVLAGYLRRNSSTDFGKRFDLANIKSAHEFQNRVPLSDYDDYREPIEQIRRGRNGVLTADPVVCLEPSSGSTRAAKLIPYTRALQSEFGRAIAPWILDLARSSPRVVGGPAYWCITPASGAEPASTVNDATPVGFASDSAYLGGWLEKFVNRTLVDCSDLRHVQEIDEFRHQTLLRLLSESELRLISIWHPTFLTLLLDALADSWSALLRDLSRGVPAKAGVRALPANPTRARILSRADPSRPTSIWPDLAVVSCWGDGQAARLLSDLQARLPGVCLQTKGLLATEGVISLPFAGRHPLAIRSHFFEFIDSRGNARFSWELEPGGSYSVVVTTGGGLYRYQLRDRVTVESFLYSTPCIRFIGKEDTVSDLRGEKLSEGLVAAILSRLIPSLAPRTTFALLAPDTNTGVPRYVLYLSSSEQYSPSLAAALESELGANPNYAHCVRLGQLRPCGIVRVKATAAVSYLERLRGSGLRLGNIKPAALSTLTGWGNVFGDSNARR
jgi:hypothetical protein